jgi:hypothetical protein
VPRTKAAAPRVNFRIAYSLRAPKQPLPFPRGKVIAWIKGAQNNNTANTVKMSSEGVQGCLIR